MSTSTGTDAVRHPRISDLDAVLARAFPREWAEEWDRVGVLAGDPDRAITGVLVTLDPTRSAIARAADAGANVLLTHHPAALSAPERFLAGQGSGGVLFAALDAGVALVAEHTNLDRAPDGVAALPALLGLEALGPVERSAQPMSRITVYAPAQSAQLVVDAMAGAGAGRIGAYEHCAFTSVGVGEFTPGDGARPQTGDRGRPNRADEVRVEMVCAVAATAAVVAAARLAHPYEEPLIVTESVKIARSSARMGMLCELDDNTTLEGLAARVSARLQVTPRVWGRRSSPIARCVTATGSGGSLIGDAIAAGADALICGEVRYHDALNAVESGLAIIEAGHDVTEWPLVGILARAALRTPGLDPGIVTAETPSAGWWTP